MPHFLSRLSLSLALCAAPALAEENAGGNRAVVPTFRSETIARFDTPWSLTRIPEGGWLVSERGGALYRVSDAGEKQRLAGVPAVEAAGQNGLLDTAFAPDGRLFLTAVVPGARKGGDLALFSARLGTAGLEELRELWRQVPSGGGGQPGGIIAFQDGALYLSVGDRMRPETMGPGVMRGVILRFAMAPEGLAAPEVVSTGHRNQYGLVFDAEGQLWEHEMGPRGGDELNLIREGRDYGWPRVSWGDHYSLLPIPDHDTDPTAERPQLYWTPVIAPSGMIAYQGALFPEWRGRLLIGGLRSQALVVVTRDPAHEEARFDMGARIRDLAEAPDGAVWVIEDDARGRLRRLTP